MLSGGDAAAALQLFDELVWFPSRHLSVYANALYALLPENTQLPFDSARARRYLAACLPHAEKNPAIHINAAYVYYALGEPDLAIDQWLYAAASRLDLTSHFAEPALAPLKENPRWAEVASRRSLGKWSNLAFANAQADAHLATPALLAVWRETRDTEVAARIEQSRIGYDAEWVFARTHARTHVSSDSVLMHGTFIPRACDDPRFVTALCERIEKGVPWAPGADAHWYRLISILRVLRDPRTSAMLARALPNAGWLGPMVRAAVREVPAPADLSSDVETATEHLWALLRAGDVHAAYLARRAIRTLAFFPKTINGAETYEAFDGPDLLFWEAALYALQALGNADAIADVEQFAQHLDRLVNAAFRAYHRLACPLPMLSVDLPWLVEDVLAVLRMRSLPSAKADLGFTMKTDEAGVSLVVQRPLRPTTIDWWATKIDFSKVQSLDVVGMVESAKLLLPRLPNLRHLLGLRFDALAQFQSLPPLDTIGCRSAHDFDPAAFDWPRGIQANHFVYATYGEYELRTWRRAEQHLRRWPFRTIRVQCDTGEALLIENG